MKEKKNELENKIKNSNILLAGVLFAIAFVLSYFRNYKFSLISDEIGNLALPAKLAGLHWDKLVQTTSYYGYGYKWIYFLFFKFLKSPLQIYACILITYLICFEIIFLLCSKILIRYTKREEMPWFLLVVFLFFFITDGNYSPLDSEFAIFINLFLFFAILYKSFYSEKKWLWTGIIGLWLSYMCTLHERGLAFVLAFIAVVIIDWIYTKKTWLSIPWFVGSFGISYVIKELLTKKIIVWLWSNNKGSLTNTSVISDSMFSSVKSGKGIVLLIKAILSNAAVININTFGIYSFVLIVAIIAVIEFFAKNKKWKELYMENRFLFVVLMLGFFATTIVLVGVSAKWAGQIVNGNPYGYKGFIYKRYYITWFYPALVAMLAIAKKNMDVKFSKLIKYAMGVNVILFVFFWHFILNTMISIQEQTRRTLFIFRAGFLGNVFSDQLKVNILLSMIFALVFCLILFSKNIYNYIAILIGIGFFANTSGFTFSNYDFTFHYQDAYKILNKSQVKPYVPDEIYVVSAEKNDPYTLQFLLKDKSIVPELPEVMDEDMIVVTRTKTDEMVNTLIEHNFTCYTVGKDQYLWVNNKESQKDLCDTLKDNSNAYDIFSNDEKLGFITDKDVNLGENEISISYLNKGDASNDSIALYMDGEKIDGEIRKDVRGNLVTFTTAFDTYQNKILAYEICSDDSKKIKDVTVHCEKLDSNLPFGTKEEEDFEILSDTVKKIGLKEPITVLACYNQIEMNGDLSYLQEKFDEKRISYVDYFEEKKNGFESLKDGYIILSKNQYMNIIFDLCNKFDIIAQTDNYILLLVRNSKNTTVLEKNNIEIYNVGNKINTIFFRSYVVGTIEPYFSNILPAGCYNIEFDCSKLNGEQNCDYFIYRRYGYEEITDVALAKNDNKKYTFTTDGKVQFAVMPKDMTQSYEPDIYISKNENLKSGDEVSFIDENKNQFISKGFYPRLEDGCWTIDRNTTINLPVEAGEDLVINIRLRSMDKQNVDIYYGEEYIKTMEVDDDFTDYQLCIPKKYIHDNTLSISLFATKFYPIPDELKVDERNDLLETCLEIQSIQFE